MEVELVGPPAASGWSERPVAVQVMGAGGGGSLLAAMGRVWEAGGPAGGHPARWWPQAED